MSRQKKDDEISFATNKSNVTKFKVVFVGDQGVGKSSIISRFIKNEFDSSHNPTIGIDFISKNLSIEGRSVRLQLWDTAGQERFRSLIPSYLKDSHGAFIIYDITSPASFDSVNKWIDFVRESRGNDTTIYVIGNKLDLASDRTVTQENARSLCEAQKIDYFEVSAKSGQNLTQIFQTLCAKLLHLPAAGGATTTSSISTISNTPNPTSSTETQEKTKVQAGKQSVVLTGDNNSNSRQIRQKGCC